MFVFKSSLKALNHQLKVEHFKKVIKVVYVHGI